MFSSWALRGLPDGRKFGVKLILEGRRSWTRIFSVSITAVFKFLIRSGDRQIGWKKRSDSKPWNTHRAILGLEADPGPWRCILRDQQGFWHLLASPDPQKDGIWTQIFYGEVTAAPKEELLGGDGARGTSWRGTSPRPRPLPISPTERCVLAGARSSQEWD